MDKRANARKGTDMTMMNEGVACMIKMMTSDGGRNKGIKEGIFLASVEPKYEGMAGKVRLGLSVGPPGRRLIGGYRDGINPPPLYEMMANVATGEGSVTTAKGKGAAEVGTTYAEKVQRINAMLRKAPPNMDMNMRTTMSLTGGEARLWNDTFAEEIWEVKEALAHPSTGSSSYGSWRLGGDVPARRVRRSAEDKSMELMRTVATPWSSPLNLVDQGRVTLIGTAPERRR